MSAILKDKLLDDTLKREGYIVIPFLSQHQVESLKQTYYGHHAADLEGMYATAHVPDISLRMQMNDAIKAVIAPRVEELMGEVNPLGGSFIAKGKGDRGTLTPHQDWNIVDESKHRSFNIWIPLVDLHASNGAICVMPRSHLWGANYRSANIPSAYHQVELELWKVMTRLDMKAGEALIYDHRLIHASGENTTDTIRLAAVFGIIPRSAEMYYYHQKDEDTITEYQSHPDFFLLGNIFEGPKNLLAVRNFNHVQRRISSMDLERLLTPNIGFWDRAKEIFRY